MLFWWILLCSFPLIFAECENDGIEFESKCYYFFTNSIDFITANLDCVSRGGYLASIHDGFTNSFIGQQGLLAIHDTSNIWIGATSYINPGNWTWTDGTDFTFSSLINSTVSSSDSCITLNLSTGAWNANDCYQQKPYILLFSWITNSVSAYEYYGIFKNIGEFINDLANDLKFSTIDKPNRSRVSYGLINQSAGNLLCFSSAKMLKDQAGNTPFDLKIGTENINLNSTLMIFDALLGAAAPDFRYVPKFAVIITDKPIIDNLDDTVAYAKDIAKRGKINFIVVGLGAGDFQSSYGKIVGPGLLFTVSDNTPATKNTFKQNFYNTVCRLSMAHGETNYSCPNSRNSQKNLWS